MARYILHIILLLLIVCSPATSAIAQLSSPSLTAQRQPITISAVGQYQKYHFEQTYLSEASLPVVINIPIGKFYMGFQSSIARTYSNYLEDVEGRSDVHASLGYITRVGGSSITLNVSGNIPTGTEKLTRDEFNTLILLSQVSYRFRVPAFGQGYTLVPSINWAIPIGKSVVFGIGFTYQTNGSYTPIEDMVDEYRPGNHYIVAAGLDVRINPISSISADVKYAQYESDKLGPESWFTAGRRISTTLQYKIFFGHDELRITGRYLSHAEGNNQSSTVFSDQDVRALPNHYGAGLRYRKRLGKNATVGAVGALRYYGATDAGIGLAGLRVGFKEQKLVDMGVFSEISFARSLSMLLNFSGTAGSFSGLSGGVGLKARI